MGCVSSKIMTRSKTFKENMRTSISRTGKESPTSHDEQMNSKDTENQILTIVSAANMIAKKLKEQESDKDLNLAKVNPNDQPKGTTYPEMMEKVASMARMGNEKNGQMGEQDNQKQSQDFIEFPVENVLDKHGSCNSSLSVYSVEKLDETVPKESKKPEKNVELWLQENCGSSSQSSASIDTDDLKENRRSYDADELQKCNSIEVAKSKRVRRRRRRRRQGDGREISRVRSESVDFSTVGSLREWLGFGAYASSTLTTRASFTASGVEDHIFDLANVEEFERQVQLEEVLFKKKLELQRYEGTVEFK